MIVAWDIGVGARTFLGCEAFLPEFAKLARKIFGPSFVHCNEDWILDDLQKTVFMWFWAPFSQIKARWTPFLLVFLGSLAGFSGILRRFSQILPRFALILPGFSEYLPGFSPNQNFWGCACTPCTRASCTTGLGHVSGWAFWFNILRRKRDLSCFIPKRQFTLYLTPDRSPTICVPTACHVGHACPVLCTPNEEGCAERLFLHVILQDWTIYHPWRSAENPSVMTYLSLAWWRTARF